MSSTVVSTLPFGLSEDKYGLIPFRYIVPPAPKDGISVLHVEDGYHLFLVPMSDDKAPPMKIIDPADKIANGLCEDYIGASLAVSHDPQEDGSVSVPGLFWVRGELSVLDVRTKHPEKVTQAQKNTARWFQSLVKIADDDWTKYKQHRFISDLQRSACKYLGYEREWNFSVFSNVTTLCWACKVSVNPQAIICSSCKSILNQEEYTKNKARFVVPA